jgi:BetI-type transcriptional repressor, C-terminal
VADLAVRAERGAPGWRLLVTEFRIHAARDPGLNRRYSALHARTVDGVAGVLASISERGEDGMPFPPRQLAELVLAIETGLALEQLARPDALGGAGAPVLRRLAEWFGTPSVLAGRGPPAGRHPPGRRPGA